MASLLKIDDSFRKIIITEDLIKRHMDENGVEWVNVYDFSKEGGIIIGLYHAPYSL